MIDHIMRKTVTEPPDEFFTFTPTKSMLKIQVAGVQVIR